MIKGVRVASLAVGAMVVLAGQAAGQIVVNGTLAGDTGYTRVWVQNQPTRFGDNRPVAAGNPGAVNTGLEVAIPLSAIGNPTVGGTIRLAAFVNGGKHDFCANQFAGGFAALTGNLGDPRFVNLDDQSGLQYIDVTLNAGTAPVMDGTKDASYINRYTQSNYTGFGDNTRSDDPIRANGSELNSVSSVVAGGVLYLFFAGNIEDNGNDFEIFFDVAAGGQNQLLGNNALVDASLDLPEGALNRMGGNGVDPGLKFDAGFAPDYYLTAQVVETTQGSGVWELRANYATVPTDPGATPGVAYYLGATGGASNGVLSGGDPGAPAILTSIDNRNTAGVTGFPGTIPNVDQANGSELNNMHAAIVAGRLYLFLGANIESNWNNLDLFIDAAPGGQNTLRGDNVDIDGNGLNRMGTNGTSPGLRFDTAFEADYWISIRNGGVPNQMWMNAATLRTDGPLFTFGGFIADYGGYSGGTKALNNPSPWPATFVDAPSGANIYTNAGPRRAHFLYPTVPPGGLIAGSIDNNNTGGVTGIIRPDGTGDVFDAVNVQTGIEISVDLGEVGWDGTSPIKIAGFINGGGHSFISNQVIGGLPNELSGAAAGNIGEPRTANFAGIAGDQFVTLSLGNPCNPFDLNGDTVVDFNDYLEFLNLFNAEDPRVDYNGDQVVDFNDYLEFLNGYNSCQ